MNYVLVLINYKPDYLIHTINTILSVDKDAKIYLLSDKKIEYKNIEFINLHDINSKNASEFLSLDIYKTSIFEENPLWKTASLRVFYLSEILDYLKINSFVHFDNDVLIYKSFSEIENKIIKRKFNITQSNSKNLVFGYSYIDNNKEIRKISDLVLEQIKLGLKNNWSSNNGKPENEMQLLGSVYKKNIDLFNLLPILPYDSDIIFDPSSYGQFIDGTHNKPKKFYNKGFTSLNTIIGNEIVSKRLKVKFKDNKPTVVWKNNIYEIANLHVHSKRLNKFLPKNYKKYI